MPITLADLIVSPDHFLHSFDQADAIFVPMDRAAYRRSIFLDDRISPVAERSMRIPAVSLGGDANGQTLQTGWVFHIAHCGSTLLARALDELGDNLVLREPLALRQVALTPNDNRLALTLRMLGKRYPATGPTVVKANVPVNFIIPEIAAASPDAPVIFLYHNWLDYLLAVLRNDNHRAWLRRVLGELSHVLGDTTALSDGECVARLWLAQMRLFHAGLARMPRSSSLDAEVFFAEPAKTLEAAAGLLEIDCSAADIERLVSGPLFSRSAKNPAISFDNSLRLQRRDALRHDLAPDIDMAGEWIDRNAPDAQDVADAISGRSLTHMA